MKAIVLKDFGSVDNLEIKDIAMPEISADEVLVRVKAISINPVDVKTRQGYVLADSLRDFEPIILGWDISGVIESTGKNVKNLARGQNVFGMVNFVGHGKGYAEYVAVPAAHLAIMPENISYSEAAASTLAALTAWQAFTYYGKLKKGDKVLIHGASGGVGHFAVQIARHLGAYVIGTSSEKNKDFVFSLGAQEHIDYKNQKFENELNNLDFVLETIGGANFVKSVKTLRNKGTIVNLPAPVSEADKESANEKELISCFFMGVFSSGTDMAKIAELLEAKIIKPYIYKVYAFNEMKEAHLEVESGTVKGKVIVEL
ncbi:NADP-dependent oxidoreductase [Flavobacterium hiemivividum]|uniref:NADP-dependent oxidoreductase n=1 Tax=Flavobacterium hiemivividum TaxID=2541734 RepID=A0A4R5CSA2_9FLAO|nr:NADP-dependent oxidoreductase [Flavobacterium hiemivividum]TDE03459.1 NADP-dependent oxidoreductase [Flavobacterium hiemivividum]